MISASHPIIVMVNNDCSRADCIREALVAAGCKVFEAERGAETSRLVALFNPQIILLDWDLPDLSPLAVIRSIRSNPKSAQIPLVLTSRDLSSERRILALEVGADLCVDCLVYPRELVARIKALLRRANYPRSIRSESAFTLA